MEQVLIDLFSLWGLEIVKTVPLALFLAVAAWDLRKQNLECQRKRDELLERLMDKELSDEES